MSRIKSKVVSNVDNLINMEVGKRMSATGEKVRKSEIIQEIADFAGVGIDNINMIKREVVTPSLPVAIKIANYFKLNVEDIFKVRD